MVDFETLNHPIWFALTTGQATMARGAEFARRYDRDVSPLAALREPTKPAFAELRELVNVGETVALFTAGRVKALRGWTVARQRVLDQMVCTKPAERPEMPLLRLTEADVPDMLALRAATEPGPFLPRTIQMGRYFGIRAEDGRLVAMAGERLRLKDFTEVSAVCTDPAFRGRGYARALVLSLAGQIRREGRIAFLHVKTENLAKKLYESIGFRVRRGIQLTVITPR